MWASRIRNQGSVSGKIRSLHWIDSTSPECNSGWLSHGNEDGSLGVSWIKMKGCCSSDTNIESSVEGSLYKSHFSLKGHNGGVRFVRWRPQGDRLVTYDSWGTVKIWRNRSNVLALDFDFTTSVLVRDMQWSPCGLYIAICGEEGELQVFSGLNGISIFAIQVVSSTQHSTHAEFTCLTWNKVSTRLALGTAKGELIDTDPTQNGQFISIMMMHEHVPVCHAQYFGPTEEVHLHNEQAASQSLSLYMEDGEVAIFPTINNTCCMCVQTRIIKGQALWNNSETVLVVVGCRADDNTASTLAARFLNSEANILLTIEPLLKVSIGNWTLLSSISWGLKDSVLFIAHGNQLYSLDVQQSIPSLKALCREFITSNMWKYKQYTPWRLPLPKREINTLDSSCPSLLPFPITTSHLSSLEHLFNPLPNNHRLHCILASEETDGNLETYSLNYEHFGSYIPLLKAEKKSGTVYNAGFSIKPVLQGNNDSSLKQKGEEFWTERFKTPETRRRRVSYTANQRQQGRLTSLICRLQSSPASVMDSSLQEDASDEDYVKQRDIYPIIAEIEGNTIFKKYKILKRVPDSSLSSPLIGQINIRSHYITCEPRRVSICLYPGNEDKELKLTSKNPEWNPRFRIYELDFGGRINRDSVKNFQIEHNDEIVLQFGRSSFGNFCLDFQPPFSPVMALCVALSSVL